MREDERRVTMGGKKTYFTTNISLDFPLNYSVDGEVDLKR